ncbi:tetratricopeptide repeat protein 39B-like isoform X2 [Engraulis encrasicolus]|uniref:tetratricopeptide repeat protein 39B-like isoform X2 n=1 Tax=Engraulis encrasicolus TaxID=184585 RepID=UPI002FD78E7A
MDRMDEITFETTKDEELASSSMTSKVDLKEALSESFKALNLFLNNNFFGALELLKPWRKDSVYHAMGYSSIMTMQAGMTFAPKDIETAIDALEEAIVTCQRFRRKVTFVEAISNMITGRTVEQMTEDERHAELCYAEVLLLRATLAFLEDESVIGFLKGGMKMRASYQAFRHCQDMLNAYKTQTEGQKTESETFKNFAGGVNMGIGSFNLMLSLFPTRVLRLLEFLGFAGDREVGLSELREGAATGSLRSILSTLTLLMFHLYVSVILGTGEGNVAEAETLLAPYVAEFPNGALMLFYTARIAELKGNFEMAQQKFGECIAAQQEWHQVHHLCYWELMWCYSFQQNWTEAYRYADLLCKESKWSQAIYVFQKASILSMMTEEEAKATGEQVEDLFRSVEGLRLRLAGKSIPTEKFAARKARRYSDPKPSKLVIPALEMMYVWNGFSIVGKSPVMAEAILSTILKAEDQLANDPKPSEYHTDDQCVVQMLKGLTLRHLGRLTEAEACFNYVISNEKNIKYDDYLAPFVTYELGLLYNLQGDAKKAVKCIENAKLNYKEYSMESRLHFRIHAALSSIQH